MCIGPGKNFMTPTSMSASGAAARADVAQHKAPGAESGPFVLNLCSSTTPMALPRAEQEELKRFSFFVSRRFEEGRERFRLHMGYFATLTEAEEWLSAVRDIYPGAWAGEAPGKKLRERAVAAAAAQAQHAAGPPPGLNVPTVHAAAPVQSRIPNPPVVRPAAMPQAAAVKTAPVSTALRAPGPGRTPPQAASSAAARPAPTVQPRVAAPAPTRGVAPAASAQSARAGAVGASSPALQRGQLIGKNPDALRNPPSVAGPQRVAAPAAAPRANVPRGSNFSSTPSAQTPHGSGVQHQQAKPVPRAPAKQGIPNSNVREVLAALAETTGETRMMPAPAFHKAGAADDPAFTDTQVLKLLETRRADGSQQGASDVESGSISLLKPDDTGTRRALKLALVENAPVSFAVQLQWSVQPVELSRVPPLAIFSAYTLYTVEGSRDGRKWYGLRLGFFSDAISAKQVAYYVRSEFASVAVVPVSPQERSRASDTDKKNGPGLAFPKKTRSGQVEEFKLIDSDDEMTVSPAVAAAVKKPAPAQQAAANAAKRGPKSSGRVRARERRGPQTLEETLEILGASQLEIDAGDNSTANESGVRHLRVEVQKNTPFSRLLERLSERVRKT